MARYDAKEVTWDKVEVLGKECLFVDLRINKDTIPDGYFMYEMRHEDEDWGMPCEIAEWILVNFFGTLLSKEPFDLESNEKGTNSYMYIDAGEDWIYFGETFEFMRERE